MSDNTESRTPPLPLSVSFLHTFPGLLFCLQLLLSSCSNTWLFTSSLLIYQIHPGSLTLPAVYGVVGMVSTLLATPYLGAWIDLTPRLTAATLLCVVQSVAVTLSSVLLALYLHFEDFLITSQGCDKDGCWIETVALVFILGFAVLAGVSSGGIIILIQKDWVVVLFGQDKNKLAMVNCWIRGIELGTRTVIPAVAGVAMSHLSYSAVAVLQGAVFLLAGLLEILLLRGIYRNNTGLAASGDKETPLDRQAENLTAKLVHIVKGFKFFFQHKLCLAGISLALLYLTVLGFDGITISFCKASGMTESVLGILFGVSSGVGFLGSVCFPFLRSKLGTNYAAFIGLTVLVLADGLCLLSIFLPDSQFMLPPPSSDQGEAPGASLTAVYLLVGGVTVARFGLHLFDLCIIQLFQEGVTESKRGIFSGVESSLCNLMDMVKFGLVIFLPSPHQFGYLVIISFTSVFLGWCVFALFTRQRYQIQRVWEEGGKHRYNGKHEELVLKRMVDKDDEEEEKEALVVTT